MKVDGLTNDEVKSHLQVTYITSNHNMFRIIYTHNLLILYITFKQKYRLHTRRPSPSPQTSGGPGPHLVVLGGIWVPPEYTTAHGGTPTLYHHQVHHHNPTGAAQPPPHFCSSQEFYTTPPPSQPLHQHHFQTFNGSSGAGTASTDSAHRQLTDMAADEEKSSESGGGERKGLAALREEGEDQSNANGSEITLKF